MAWKVKEGQKVNHDGVEYIGGQSIPCSDAQAANMPHAVEKVAEDVPVKSKPAPLVPEFVPEAPVAMVADIPEVAVEAKAEKPAKRGK